ncbi:ABC transporter substrate-binding protein [Herbidospora cretacea]|uniref:ABC transporter substrate-binding protein n=1 Tax=Herbidospora cretacea TaxID=28444 RepID=UPI0004C3405E|nr:ABC transporter substrate-binding protein [Herbidospora cretacea]
MNKWTKPAAAVAAAVAAVVLAAGCGSGTGTGGGSGSAAVKADNTLVIGRTVAVDGMSGDSCYGAGSISTMPMIYGNLLTNKPDGSGVQPGIAASYDYDADARTYTFQLREDAGFSDGSPVTAADVAFSFEQWRDGKTSGSYYDMVKSAEATGEHTVVVHLTRPDTFLPALLTWCTSTVYPDHYAGKTPEKFFAAPVGAGPFAFVSWQNPGPSETITLKKNPHYYGAAKGEPHVDGVVVKTSADAAQQMLAFQGGQLDLIEGLTADEGNQLAPEQARIPKPSQARDLMLNAKRPALADVNLRKAISAAIDRQALASVQQGYVVPATGMLPTNVPNSVPPTTPYTYDLAAAKTLMAKRADPKPVSLTLGFEGSSSTLSTMAQLLRDQLAKIGVEVTLKPSDSATVYSQGSSGDFDMLISDLSAISPTVFDPISFVLAAWSPWTGADSALLKDKFTVGTSTTDDAVKDAAVRAIQDDAQAQSTVIGMVNMSTAFAVAGYVEGFTATPFLSWDAATVKIRTGS